MPRRPDTARTAYLALAALDSALAARPAARPARRVTKPLLMPALHLAFREKVRRSGARPGDRLTRATTAAQALSWGGDVALLGRGEAAFLAGLGSFFGAHVAYVAGFGRATEVHRLQHGAGSKAAAATWVLLAPVMATAAGRRDPKLRLPVAGYAAVLAAMFAAASSLDPVLPTEARRKAVTGAALFLLSDSLLGAQRFLRSTPSPVLEAAVMATYTAGQWYLADGVADVATAAD